MNNLQVHVLNMIKIKFAMTREYISRLEGGVPYLYVIGSDRFRQQNPGMVPFIRKQDELEYIALNISDQAIRELNSDRSAPYLTFKCRVRGVEQLITVWYNDILGLGDQGSEIIFEVSTAMIVEPDFCGAMIFSALESQDPATVAPTKVLDETSKPVERPSFLKVVK